MAAFIGNTQVRVHLAAGALVACEVEHSRWHRTVVKRKERFAFEAGDRAAAMAELSRWMPHGSSRRSIVWVIGPALAQYFVLPWSPALIDLGLRDAYARAHFEQTYERDASSAAFSFGPATRGGSQVVSWVPAELPLELAAHAQEAGFELAGIKPAILAVWERFRDVLETETGTLCVVDGNRQTIVRHDRKRIEDIVIRPCDRPLVRPAARREGVFRRFSNESLRRPADTSPADLNLPAQHGFVAARDGAYAFALCGAL